MAIPKICADDFGMPDDIRGLALDEDFSEIEHDGAIDQRHDDFHDVLDHQHRDAGLAHLAHQRHAGLRLERREAGEALVEQQQLRLGGQSAGARRRRSS